MTTTTAADANPQYAAYCAAIIAANADYRDAIDAARAACDADTADATTNAARRPARARLRAATDAAWADNIAAWHTARDAYSYPQEIHRQRGCKS